MDVLEASDDIVLEMDLIGMLSEERNEQHPYLNQQSVETGRFLGKCLLQDRHSCRCLNAAFSKSNLSVFFFNNYP